MCHLHTIVDAASLVSFLAHLMDFSLLGAVIMSMSVCDIV